MLPNHKVIKETAQKNLKNNWVSAIAIVIVFLSSVFTSQIFLELYAVIFENILGIGAVNTLLRGIIMLPPILVLFIFNLPLLEGVIRWFWYLQQNERLPISEVFYYYSSKKLAVKSVVLYLLLFARTVLPAILLYIPSFAVFAFTKTGSFSSIKAVLGIPTFTVTIVGLALFLLASLLIIKNALNYILAPIIFLSDEGKDYEFSLNLSKTIAKRNKSAFFITFMSFVGFIILSFLGIPTLFTVPFLLMSYVVFSRFALVNYGIKLS